MARWHSLALIGLISTLASLQATEIDAENLSKKVHIQGMQNEDESSGLPEHKLGWNERNEVDGSFREDAKLLNRKSIIKYYKKQFVNELSANIFTSPEESKISKDFIQEITRRCKDLKIEISIEELENRWQDYMLERFNTKEAFQRYLKTSYLTKDYVKFKFKQNQYFKAYFEKIVIPKIDKEIAKIETLLSSEEAKKIRLEEHEIIQEFFQIQENWGGKNKFKKYLATNELAVKDIVTVIRYRLMADKLSRLET